MVVFMKFHQGLSIVFGIITSFVLYLIVLSLFSNGLAIIPLILSFIIGGFISVFYARKRKIQFALYEGIFVMLIIVVLLGFVVSSDFIIAFLYGVLIILLALIGGMIALMTDKNYRQFFKTKYLDKGFNFITIVTGIIITFIIWFFVFFVTYLILNPTNPNTFTLVLIETAELIGISVIGGFITTFMVKEKQLLNGICVGLGIIIITIILNVYAIIKGHQNSYLSSPLIITITTLWYIIAPTLGSYLAITISEKNNSLKE